MERLTRLPRRLIAGPTIAIIGLVVLAASPTAASPTTTTPAIPVVSIPGAGLTTDTDTGTVTANKTDDGAAAQIRKPGDGGPNSARVGGDPGRASACHFTNPGGPPDDVGDFFVWEPGGVH